MLLAPPGCKEVIYEENKAKEYYFDKGFKDTSIGCCPNKIINVRNGIQAIRKQYGSQHYITGTMHSIMGDTLPSLATSLSVVDRNYQMWDKGQLLVIISRTRKAEDTIYVGEKNNTLDALCNIVKHCTQWTDYMENVLKVVTINQDEEDLQSRPQRYGNSVMDYSSFPYRPCDIHLPTDRTGFVYMLISLRLDNFFYIGKIKDLNQRMRSHQSGRGSNSTQPQNLRPYAYFAYIFGFNEKETMIFYIERKWKEFILGIRNQGIHDQNIWASEGGNSILNLNLENFGVTNTREELQLVLLYK